jgi:DNA-binding transcriptional LysR family regulator
MDRLDAMAMLVAAVDEGSLAKAARKLGRSPASITRGVALLEARAGERLLHRTTRSLKLTEAGTAQVAIYRQVLDQLAQTDRESDVLGGKLTVSAPELFGQRKVMPILAAFLNDHPGVTARVLLLNRVVDMVEEGVDLSLRIARLQDSVLTAVRLGTARRLVCASPEYLAHAGEPQEPGDLAAHACINLQVGGGHEAWQLRTRPTSPSRLRTVPIGSRVSVNNQATALDMALRGNGICHPLSYQVADEIREGRLVRLLQDYEPDPVPVHFVFHPSQRQGGIVRSLVARAAPILRADLAEIERTFG